VIASFTLPRKWGEIGKKNLDICLGLRKANSRGFRNHKAVKRNEKGKKRGDG
jgi:hypothetical protein